MLAGVVAACSEPPQTNKAPAKAQVASANLPAAPAPAPVDQSANTAVADPPASPEVPAGRAIDQATTPGNPGPGVYDPGLVRLEVLLDRAGFSPGVIDGHEGDNLNRAVAAYAQARRPPAAADLTQAVFQALAAKDRAPAMQTYQISEADTAGPFIGTPPKNYTALARLKALSYSDSEQLLAERFHMDRRLLEALNPGVDFTQPGAAILVTAPRSESTSYQVSRIEVDKSNDQVRAYGADGALLTAYPATVGSVERPAPSGQFAVKSVARNPDYVYDPSRLTFRVKGAHGKLTLRPGPNNPVGTTWIALTYPTYGIHGTPDPSLIGKRASHGCIRLTNWDAAELGRSVGKGVEVDFVGAETIPKTG